MCFWAEKSCQDVKLVVLLWAICQMFMVQRGWSFERVRYDILKLIKELYPGPADFPGFMVGNYLSIIPDPTLFYKRWTRGVLSVLLIYPKSYSFSFSYICQQGPILHSTFYLVYKKFLWRTLKAEVGSSTWTPFQGSLLHCSDIKVISWRCWYCKNLVFIWAGISTAYPPNQASGQPLNQREKFWNEKDFPRSSSFPASPSSKSSTSPTSTWQERRQRRLQTFPQGCCPSGLTICICLLS